MLARHRDVVSNHEFFTGLDWGRRFADGDVTGAELRQLIGAEQPVTTAVLSRGYTSDEIQYPFGRPGVRFRPTDPTPWLLVTMLSRLTDDPDTWYDELLHTAERRPPATMAEHYRYLFDWLTRRAGGSMWVERSGSSIDYLGELARLYPRARFVHIHRDGHEAALSIRGHPFFRLAVTLLMDLFPDTADEEAAVTEVIETQPPCWAVGRYWSDQVLRGFAALPLLDREQFLQVRFEDLVASPAKVLGEIAAFFELPPDRDFTERGAGLVGTPPPSRFGDLDAAEQEELREACRAGQVLLGRHN
jgi:putative sulfotransferase